MNRYRHGEPDVPTARPTGTSAALERHGIDSERSTRATGREGDERERGIRG